MWGGAEGGGTGRRYLDVSMHHAVFVQVLERRQQLPRVDANGLNVEFPKGFEHGVHGFASHIPAGVRGGEGSVNKMYKILSTNINTTMSASQL